MWENPIKALDYSGTLIYVSGVRKGAVNIMDVIREADAKGRVTLGKRFANRAVIVENIDETTVKISLARVIPEREMWLWENPEARDKVLLGLRQAEDGEFAESPDLEAEGRFTE